MRVGGAGKGRLMLAAGALIWLAGCYTGAPILEADYGRSVSNNTAQMVVNPQAGQDLSPAVGLDPKAAANLQDKYDKSFKGEEKVAPTISITTSAGK